VQPPLKLSHLISVSASRPTSPYNATRMATLRHPDGNLYLVAGSVFGLLARSSVDLHRK
jgi:hypothetical protein